MLLASVLVVPSASSDQTYGTFVETTLASPSSVDPAVETSPAGMEVIQNVYQTLVWYDGPSATDLVPVLATDVPTIENGGMAADGSWVVYHIRSDVKFHNGETMTAYDVVYSIERVLMINDPTGPAYMLGQVLFADYANMTYATKEQCASVIGAPDASTVSFNLTRPCPAFNHIMATTLASVVSMKYVEENGGIALGERNPWMDTHTCGTGPYLLTSFQSGLSVELERFDDHWQGAAPIEKVSIRVVSDVPTGIIMLQNGDADSAYITMKEESTLSSDPDLRVVKGDPTFMLSGLGPNQHMDLSFNPASGTDTIPEDFFSDREVRLAFAKAYDAQSVIDSYYLGGAVLPNGPILQGMEHYNASIPAYVQDLNQAAYHLNLAQTGSGDTWGERGFNITLFYNQGNVLREAQCNALRIGLENLTALGLITGEVNVAVQGLDFPSYLSAMRNDGLPILFTGWKADNADPENMVTPFFQSSGTFFKQCDIDNASLSELCDMAATTLDPTQRASYYDMITQAALDNGYYIWTAQTTSVHAERAWISGYYQNPMHAGLYFFSLSFEPGAPGQVTGLDGRSNSGRVALFWSEVPGATSYLVYRSDSIGGVNTLVGEVDQPRYLDDAVTDGVTYSYNVTAVNSQGEGPSSGLLDLIVGPSGPLPLHIDNDNELTAMDWLYDWPGTGEHNGTFDPIYIQDLDSDIANGDAIYIGNTTLMVFINNCSFTGAGISASGASYLLVSQCHLNESFISFTGCQECHVGNSTLVTSSVYLDHCNSCHLSSNTFIDAGAAWSCNYVTSSQFAHNTVLGNYSATGVDLLTSFLRSDDNYIGYNQIEGAWNNSGDLAVPGQGMVLQGERNILEENHFLNCSMVFSPSEGVDLGSNIVYSGNTANGDPILFYSNWEVGWTINGRFGELIFVNVPNVHIDGVQISNGSIGVQAIGCSGMTIANSRIEGCSIGIELYACSYVTLTGNDVSGCLTGLEMDGLTTWTTVENNSLHGCFHGARTSAVEVCTFTGNNISDNRYGLYLVGCFLGLMQINLIGNNTYYGIFMGEGSSANIVEMNRFFGNNGSNETYDPAHAQAYDDEFDAGQPNLWYGGWGADGLVGNLWSDWLSPDVDQDGYVDQSYPLAGSSTDPYPLAYLQGPPGPPRFLSAQAQGDSIVLSWTSPLNRDVVGVDSYNIYRWNGVDAWDLLGSTWETTYIDPGLSVGVQHTYQVSASNTFGESPRSENATSMVFTIPDAPTGLRGDISGGTAHLNWDAPYDGGGAIDYYVVYSNGVEAQTVYAGTYAEVAGLSSGVTYIFTVRAHNAAGLSNESEDLTLIERTVPSAPVLKAEWGDDRVDLTWSTPYNGGSPVTGYILYKQWPGLSNWTEIGKLKVNSYADTSVLNGQTYAYKVRATNAVGDGKMSNVVRGSPLTLPSAPEVYILNPGDHRLYSAWAAPDDDGGSAVIEYIVYLDGVQYATTTGQDLNITGLTNGIAYSVTVKARTAAGVGPFSGPMTATPVGLPGAPGDLVATVEPNSITLSWQAAAETGGAGPVQYRVYVTYPDGSPLLLITTSATSYLMPMGLDDVDLSRVYKVQSFNAQGIGGNATTQSVEPLVLYVSGMVVDENGERKPGVLVKSQDGGQTITDSDGLFALQVEPGSITLTFESTGYSKTLRQVEVGEEPVDIGVVSIPPVPAEEPPSNDYTLLILAVVGAVIVVGGAVLFLRRKH